MLPIDFQKILYADVKYFATCVLKFQDNVFISFRISYNFVNILNFLHFSRETGTDGRSLLPFSEKIALFLSIALFNIYSNSLKKLKI